MLRLARFERSFSCGQCIVDAVFDDPQRDDGACVEYRFRNVPPQSLLSYIGFQRGTLAAVGQVYTFAPSESATRRRANELWKLHTQKLLDGAGRREHTDLVGITKPLRDHNLITK